MGTAHPGTASGPQGPCSRGFALFKTRYGGDINASWLRRVMRRLCPFAGAVRPVPGRDVDQRSRLCAVRMQQPGQRRLPRALVVGGGGTAERHPREPGCLGDAQGRASVGSDGRLVVQSLVPAGVRQPDPQGPGEGEPWSGDGPADRQGRCRADVRVLGPHVLPALRGISLDPSATSWLSSWPVSRSGPQRACGIEQAPEPGRPSRGHLRW